MEDNINTGYTKTHKNGLNCHHCDYSFKPRKELKKIVEDFIKFRDSDSKVGIRKLEKLGINPITETQIQCPNCKKNFKIKFITSNIKNLHLLSASDCRLNEEECKLVKSEDSKHYVVKNCKKCDNFTIKR